jgi:nitrate/nitrite transporter NarK
MSQGSTIRGHIVGASGTGINLALGVLYTWSIFKVAIIKSIEAGGAGAFQWDLSSLNDPYATCCFVFSVSVILAGKCQDTYGPRITAAIGGVLVGVGFIWISQTTAYISWLLGFGILVGIGIAFGYSPTTPAAMKWFPPNQVGKITGCVVAGFGLASVCIAPLTTYLLKAYGFQKTMLALGIAFLIVVCGLAMFLANPPEGYRPAGYLDRRDRSKANLKNRALFKDIEMPPKQVVKTSNFWILWVLYFIGAGTGLMVVGNIAGMAKTSLGENAFIAVALLAIGNALGRIEAGMMSDKIGRKKALITVFGLQAILMFVTIPISGSTTSHAFLLVFLTTFIGFNYGANLTVFPSFAKDIWGMKNFGMNYGSLFSAWGVGGLVMSKVSQMLMSTSGSFNLPLMFAGIMLVAGACLVVMVKDQKDQLRQKIASRKPKGALAPETATS